MTSLIRQDLGWGNQHRKNSRSLLNLFNTSSTNIPNRNNHDNQGNSFKNAGPVNTAGLAGDQATHYQVTAAPVDGLKIGGDYYSTENGTAKISQSTGQKESEAEGAGSFVRESESETERREAGPRLTLEAECQRGCSKEPQPA